MHTAYMKRMGRKRGKGVEHVLEKHVRPGFGFGDRAASPLTTADFERSREGRKGVVEPTTIRPPLVNLQAHSALDKTADLPRPTTLL